MSRAPAFSEKEIDMLEIDVDSRMLPVWERMDADPDITEAEKILIARYLRFAYCTGYCACLTDPVYGQLFNDNNLSVPRRRPMIPQ